MKKIKKHFSSSPTPRVAVAELLFAALIWGFGFIAVKWSLDSAGPFWIATIRFFLAFVVGLFFVLREHGPHKVRSDFKRAAIPGVLIASALILQTIGLKYTTVTNSGFITTLYALIVPFFELLFFKKRVGAAHVLYLAIALFGTVLISQFNPFSGRFNFGDFLTLLCAIATSFHITYLSGVSKQIDSPFVFNVFQSFWAGVVSLFCALLLKDYLAWPPSTMTSRAVVSLCFLALGSSLFAFFIQVRVQKVLSASLSSLLFLLESPLAAVLAFFILRETLTQAQWVGAVLILLSTILAVRKT